MMKVFFSTKQSFKLDRSTCRYNTVTRVQNYQIKVEIKLKAIIKSVNSLFLNKYKLVYLLGECVVLHVHVLVHCMSNYFLTFITIVIIKGVNVRNIAQLKYLYYS